MEHHNCLLVDTAWLGFLPRGVGVGWVGTGTLLGPGITNPNSVGCGFNQQDQPGRVLAADAVGSWVVFGSGLRIV